MNDIKVYIVTKFDDDEVGYVQRGVYSTESNAIAACLDTTHEYCETVMDKKIMGEYLDWNNPKENPE